jgi:hypothetical protein
MQLLSNDYPASAPRALLASARHDQRHPRFDSLSPICEFSRVKGERTATGNNLEGCRVLILTGDFEGDEGVCLGRAASSGLWAISPDNSDEVLPLAFEKDFGLLLDLSGNPRLN